MAKGGTTARVLLAALRRGRLFFVLATMILCSCHKGGNVESSVDIEALLKSCEANGKLDGIEIEYYVGGGLPPPLYVSNQFRFLTLDGREVMQFAQANYDPKYAVYGFKAYPIDIYRLPSSPDDLKHIARLIREAGVFQRRFHEEEKPFMADMLRTELNLKSAGKTDGRIYYVKPPASFGNLVAAIDALIERLKKQGEHGVYYDGKKIEEPKR